MCLHDSSILNPKIMVRSSHVVFDPFVNKVQFGRTNLLYNFSGDN